MSPRGGGVFLPSHNKIHDTHTLIFVHVSRVARFGLAGLEDLRLSVQDIVWTSKLRIKEGFPEIERTI